MMQDLKSGHLLRVPDPSPSGICPYLPLIQEDDLVQADRLDGAQIAPEMGADTAEMGGTGTKTKQKLNSATRAIALALTIT